MANQQVKVVRPFWFYGKQHYAGSVLEVPTVAAAELIAMGKATKYDPPLKAAPRVEPQKESTK